MLTTKTALSIIAALALVSCASETTEETSTSIVVATSSTTATTEPAPTTTATTAPATIQPEVSERQFGFLAPISITVPASWAREPESSQEVLYIDVGINQVMFAIDQGPETVDGWLERLTTDEDLIATEPTPVAVGGAPGYTLDVRLAPGGGATSPSCQPAPCEPLFTAGFRGWNILDGLPNRLWIVDLDGSPVLIAAEASEESFEAFIGPIEEALATLEWGERG